MSYAITIVDKLITKGIIPSDYRNDATKELHRELKRRSMRISQSLAMLVSAHQLAIRLANDEAA